MAATSPPPLGEPEPREASTLVLMRDRAPGTPEVLMVQRHARDAFAASAYVFPGGVLEDDDASASAAALSPRLSPAAAREVMQTVEDPHRALAYLVAAIRETFEEVGVLLARKDGRPWRPDARERNALRRVRRGLHDGSVRFADWAREEDLELSTDALAHFAHWITPAGRPKRFDTRFFLAAADGETAVEPDEGEIVGYRWLTPAEGIAAAEAGEIRLVNATLKNLELLDAYSSTGEALAAMHRRRVHPILPKITPLAEGGRRIVYPWDADYEQL